MVLQAVRSDALPEGKDHPDEGCDLYPRCLDCPMNACRYDKRNGIATLRVERRRVETIDLRRQGMTVEEIAARLRISKRTVWKDLESWHSG